MTDSWDVIVVGAGSSGLALAARLADRGARVLITEAGADFRSDALPTEWRSPNPINGFLSHTRDEYLWTELRATRTELQEPSLLWRGRGVGGSSIVNGQIAIRPPAEDFDEWAEAGCPGWSYAEVLPYLCRLEDDLEFGGESFHGAGGPIPIYRHPVSAWGAVDKGLRAAALEHGFPWIEDVNAPGATGVSPYPINSRDLRRVTTNDGYLEPRRGLANLKVRAKALVDSVLLRDGRAVGIRVADGSQVEAGQVVLAAGVIGSAEILMRSGIGPAAALRSLGIPVVQDLPVGQNLQDHPVLRLSLPLRPELAAGREDRHTNCCVRYSSGLDGPANDLMIVAMNQNVLALQGADTRAGSGAVGVWLNRADSTGEVTLVSRDPRRSARVRERMLSDETDLKRMRLGAQLLVDLLGSPALKDICAIDPRDVNRDFIEAAAGGASVNDVLLRGVSDAQHGTSTCRMGAADAGNVVVDPDCRVLGIDRLSVVDASVLPFVPGANTNLVAIMLGEVMGDRLTL
ncbi:GMC family oxidoreductase [Amycolatopsis panacis]|uniref:FAD-binding protein n=1 Tax=Amycolatopsis panacis TaxID=2340917 RepID=A0A419I2I7_9PSEU|nr:GMC family oxidoreductase N-terminal domain-containing protein [Amycolatopsis panacis]RJQ84178.1 FAD-binding protein [Amycolatopsis panacis]